jgi:hypothetical protein
MGFCVHVTESTPRQVREVSLERLVGDVEELERGIALYLWFCLAESATVRELSHGRTGRA